MEIYANKGCFQPGESITLTILCDEETDVFYLTLLSMDRVVGEFSVTCAANATQAVLPPIDADFAGFAVICRDNRGRECRCAFDVQRTIRAFRYGFLSDFTPRDGGEADVISMAKHHINAVQFYDWSYRHDTLVADTDEYADMMGKRNSLSVIRAKIASCHAHGMRALGYGAVYAASETFAQQHSDWRLYAGEAPLRFIDVFSIMNLRTQWKRHLIEQYRSAICGVGFDGIHMDTYGFPKTALDSNGKTVHLEEDFPQLIEDTRKELPDAALVFNNVGAWPMEKTMHAPTDAVYVEVWPPYKRYSDLKQLILEAQRAGKPVVMAAYPAAFRTADADSALQSQLILTCLFAAHGATQLWFGEENAAVTQGYYADYSRLTEAQEKTLRAYDDFFVRYEEWFFDPALRDVSSTHFDWDNIEYRCDFPCTVTGEAGKLWLILREDRGRKLISILNLCGDDSDLWAEGHAPAAAQKDVTLKVQCFGRTKSVLTAAPEIEGGDLRACVFETVMGERSPEISVTLPVVGRFALIWIETEE